MAFNANRMYGINHVSLAKTSEKLGSGYRINRSADDAAGLAISEKIRRQIRGLSQASLNAQDGISMVQSAEGALNETHEMLQRMNELCIKSANDTMTSEDREYAQMEIRQSMQEIDRIAGIATFNDRKLFDGLDQTKCTAVAGGVKVNGAAGTVTQPTGDQDATYTMNPLQLGDSVELIDKAGNTQYYQIATRDQIRSADAAAHDGSAADKPKLVTVDDALWDIGKALARYNANENADEAQSVTAYYSGNDGKFNLRFNGPLDVKLQVGAEKDQYIEFKINSINTATLGLEDLDVRGNDNTKAAEGIDLLKSAISQISRERAKLGAVQNRLEHTIRNLDNVAENTTAAESLIRDTDMPKALVTQSIQSMVQDAGFTLMAQANQSNRGVLAMIGA